MAHLSHQEIIEIAEAAGMAPSGDNVQPWRFVSRYGGSIFDIQIDRNRDTSSLNVRLFPSLISVGAAMENVRLLGASRLAKHFQCEPMSEISESEPYPLAIRMRVDDMAPKVYDPKWADAIHLRNTHRNPFQGDALQKHDFDILEKAKTSANEDYPRAKTLFFHEASFRDKICELVADSSKLLFEVDSFRSHIFGNVRFPGKHEPVPVDGMPLATLGIKGLQTLFVRALKFKPFAALSARFGTGKQLSEHDRLLASSASVFGLILSASSKPADMIYAGAAMQRIWLAAFASGLSVQPMTSPMLHTWMNLTGSWSPYKLSQKLKAIIIAKRFTDLFSSQTPSEMVPAMFFRIGRAATFLPRTGRRPVESALIFE